MIVVSDNVMQRKLFAIFVWSKQFTTKFTWDKVVPSKPGRRYSPNLCKIVFLFKHSLLCRMLFGLITQFSSVGEKIVQQAQIVST